MDLPVNFVSWMQAILTCLEDKKADSSAHEFLKPLQFQPTIPTGGRGVFDGRRDAGVVVGPGFGWIPLMSRRRRMRIRETKE